MDENKRIPDLHEVLEKSSGASARRVVAPEDIPPPPRDWVSHPVTRTVLVLILLAIISLMIWKAPEWVEWIRDHPFGAGIVGLVLFGLTGVTAWSFFRYRAWGDLGEKYWDSGRKRRKR